MSGFNITGAEDGPSNTIETLRAHRWIISELGPVKDALKIARDVTLPQMRIERQEILGGLIWYKFAKAVKFEDVEIVFYDNGQVLTELEKWKALVWTPTSGIQKHSDYKKDCVFTLLSTESPNTIKLKNAWPAIISHSRLTYTSSEIKQINLTLAYDWAESVEMSPGGTPMNGVPTAPPPITAADRARWAAHGYNPSKRI